MTASLFTATHKPTGRRVSVSGRHVVYHTPAGSGQYVFETPFDAAQTALQWLDRAVEPGEAA
jgi:hypothetical protein